MSEDIKARLLRAIREDTAEDKAVDPVEVKSYKALGGKRVEVVFVNSDGSEMWYRTSPKGAGWGVFRGREKD